MSRDIELSEDLERRHERARDEFWATPDGSNPDAELQFYAGFKAGVRATEAISAQLRAARFEARKGPFQCFARCGKEVPEPMVCEACFARDNPDTVAEMAARAEAPLARQRELTELIETAKSSIREFRDALSSGERWNATDQALRDGSAALDRLTALVLT